MATYTDQIGRTISLLKTPKRIVSTVPSQTELLYKLGLEQEVVGITAYCVHPADWLNSKTVIGGTKNLDIQKIRDLNPDLILCNKEENIRDQVDQLSGEFPVWVSDINTVDDSLEMIKSVGHICDRENEAKTLLENIETVRAKLHTTTEISFLYLIWKDPIMVAGKNTFISNIFKEVGFKNLAPETGQRYPEINLEDLKIIDPQIIMLSSEPYSFTTGQAHDIQINNPKSLIKIVDGELFSWYGSRIVLTFRHLPKIISEINLLFLKK